tara:strand:+ start:493 stop:990 length:498 start_codon:yes stop_codon:yes gene_type:complete
MWTIISFDKKKINLLKQDLKLKIGEDFKVYIPKIRVQKFKKNKLVSKDFNLLGNYMFFFNNKIESQYILNSIKFSRGLKYFLEGFKNSQKEIQNFIDECKKNESKDGFISKNFYHFCLSKHYKFQSGPFVDKIFKIIKLEEKKINILIGNLKTTVNKEDFSYSTV